MIAVTAAMVVPSISNISQGDIKEESNRLRLVMSFALDESQLSGVPIRFVATKQGWTFESYVEPRRNKDDVITIEQQPKWLLLGEPPLAEYVLPDGIDISQIEQVSDVEYEALINTDNQNDKKEPVLGVILLLPDGTTSLSNIYLKNEEEKQVVLEVRPGPAGIRVKKEGEF